MALDSTKPLNEQNELSCVYSITRIETGSRYIGSTRNFKKRRSGHLHALRSGAHKNRRLQSDWSLYGEASFSFDLLLVCECENLIENEQKAMEAFSPEYNLAPTAGSQLGIKLSDETRDRMSKAKVVANLSPATREKLRASSLERRHSPETIEKMRTTKANISQETRLRMSAMSGQSKKVVCGGVIYESARQAALAIGIKYTTLGAMLRGQNANKFDAKYLTKEN